VAKYLTAKGHRLLAALDTVSAQLGATPAEVSLAWLIARPGVTAPIASATTQEQLASLVKATTLKLTPAQVEALDVAGSD
jgi:aryl-alcohol dehydrogenase-like predicted oxidoreductase